MKDNEKSGIIVEDTKKDVAVGIRISKKTIKIIIAVVVAIAVIAAVLIGMNLHWNNYWRNYWRNNPDSPAPSSDAPIISSEVIKSKLSDIGELATEEYSYTGVERFEKSKGWKIFDFLTKASFICSYDGTIKAGINFKDVDVAKNDTTKIITVTLPEAKILSSELDEKSFKLYDEKKNIFNPFGMDDMNDMITELKANGEASAIEKGLLERADKNAERLIKQFVGSIVGDDYHIEIKHAAE